jgi:outer membrane lipoprotein SlyB
MVGTTEGLSVGMIEGCMVGTTEGLSVGIIEGCFVGTTEGCTVGGFEGYVLENRLIQLGHQMDLPMVDSTGKKLGWM